MKDDRIRLCIKSIWGELLGLDEPDPEAHFIDLGGASITAEQVAARIRNELAIGFTGQDVLRYGTLVSVISLASERARPSNPQQQPSTSSLVGSGGLYDRQGGLLSSPGYRSYVLVLLIVVGTLAWIDRNVFAAVLEGIKTELHLSDTELGLLGGTAFGLFNAVVGLPVAWFADRSNRRSLIASAIAVWSGMTVLCGIATGFFSLLVARIGVGLGEAGGTPPSHSLISDYYPPSRRGFALGLLYLYIPFGFLFGFLAGGWINQYFGWRTAFLVVGIPGIVVALIVRLTLVEPPRGHSEVKPDPLVVPPILSTIRFFLSKRALRHIPLGGSIYGIGAFAVTVWTPAFLSRTHHMSSGEAGTWMAIAYGAGGALGTLIGGYWSDRVAQMTRDPRWYAWISAIAIASTAPLFAIVFLSPLRSVALLALCCAAVLGHVYLGPITAMMQGVAGVRQRAMVAAFYLFFANLIGLGLGPLVIGVVSDYFGGRFGSDALRLALLAVVPAASLWASTHFFIVSRSLRSDMQA